MIGFFFGSLKKIAIRWTVLSILEQLTPAGKGLSAQATSQFLANGPVALYFSNHCWSSLKLYIYFNHVTLCFCYIIMSMYNQICRLSNFSSCLCHSKWAMKPCMDEQFFLKGSTSPAERCNLESVKLEKTHEWASCIMDQILIQTR